MATADRFCVGRLEVDDLPDDLLIYIFKLYRRDIDYYYDAWPWLALVHVCKRWRRIIFAWPHHIDVRHDCKSGTAVTKALDAWPNLPISIRSRLNHNLIDSDGGDLIAALEHRDRMVGIDFSSGLSKPQLERCAALMQAPFPFLRTLSINCYAVVPPMISDAFLGGSTPRLQKLSLCHVPFPTLPKLLLSAHDLVELRLEYFASTGYISSDVMATCMSVLARLQYVGITFWSTKSIPQVRTDPCPLLPTRARLPALATLVFSGVREYSEDLMSRIDAPLLRCLRLKFHYQPIIDNPQLSRLINGMEKLKSPLLASIVFHADGIEVSMSSSVGGSLILEFTCTGLDKQISLLERFWTQCLPLRSQVRELELSKTYNLHKDQQNTIPWLGFLRPFKALQILYLRDGELGVEIAHVLGEHSRQSILEMLPMLYTLKLDRCDQVGLLMTLLKPFIDARRLFGHPVTMEWEDS